MCCINPPATKRTLALLIQVFQSAGNLLDGRPQLFEQAEAGIGERHAARGPMQQACSEALLELTALERLSKRLLDVTVAATSLVLLVPLLVVVAVAIKLESRGPVIFRQRRHGFNGRSFAIYKLRTMRVMEDGAAVVQATEKDPRVTRVG